MARDIEAGRAFVRVSMKSTVAGDLKKLGAKIRTWGAGLSKAGMGIAGLGLGVTGAMTAMSKSFASAGDTVDKMSSRLGTSAEFISRIGHAAAIGGTDLNTMEAGIRRLQRTALDAERGLSTATDAFAMLGVSTKDASGDLKPTEQLFLDTASALADVENASEKAALAQMVFGRAGTQLLPMLANGKEGLQEVMAEADKLGITLSKEDATSAAELTDAMYRLQETLKGVATRIGAAVAPMLTDMAAKVTSVVSRVIAFAKTNKAMIATAFKIAAAVAAAGAAIMAVGATVAGLGFVFTGIGAAVSAVAAAFGVLLSPIGLVVAAIVGGVAAWVRFTDAGKETVAGLSQMFTEIADFAKETWGGIVDALKAGDIKLALQIASLSAQQVWQEMVLSLTNYWGEMLNSLIDATSSAINSIIDIWKPASKTLAKWMADAGYKVALMMSGEKDYLTDEERTGARDSAINDYYDDLEDKLRTVLTEPKNFDTSDIEAEIERLKALRAESVTTAKAAAAEVAARDSSASDETPGKPDMPDTGAISFAKGIGTFSAQAAGVMFQSRTEDAIRSTAENTKETADGIRKLARRRTVVFG